MVSRKRQHYRFTASQARLKRERASRRASAKSSSNTKQILFCVFTYPRPAFSISSSSTRPQITISPSSFIHFHSFASRKRRQKLRAPIPHRLWRRRCHIPRIHHLHQPQIRHRQSNAHDTSHDGSHLPLRLERLARQRIRSKIFTPRCAVIIIPARAHHRASHAHRTRRTRRTRRRTRRRRTRRRHDRTTTRRLGDDDDDDGGGGGGDAGVVDVDDDAALGAPRDGRAARWTNRGRRRGAPIGRARCARRGRAARGRDEDICAWVRRRRLWW
mmetsp:Transcript_8342/g.27802  ORF Transcript_8342/g.27802 Transcript_8342/m.27802 type:complete len:272 (-) Transcript_8342:26-841(-)